MRLEFARPWVRFPAGLRCVFSSDPTVSSSYFVGAEREENLKPTDFFGKQGDIRDILVLAGFRETTEGKVPKSNSVRQSSVWTKLPQL